MKAAVTNGEAVRGIMGATPLARIPTLDLVWGIVPDYMHCVLEGVTKQLTEAWMSSTASPFYIGVFINDIDDRLQKITPPTLFSRCPRGLKERALWKAKEWRYWLLYYALPCLQHVLPRQYHNHFSLLCQGIFLLLKKKVQMSDITASEALLERFLHQVAPLYGEVAETSNIHLLKHLPKSVSKLGPLWATSMFPFENCNGTLLKFITASKGAPQQVAERWVMRQRLLLTTAATSLPHHLHRAFKSFLKGTVRRTDGPLGSTQVTVFTPAQEAAIVAYFSLKPTVEKYNRAFVHGLEIQCAEYKRCNRTCSRFLKMKDGTYCEVQCILKATGRQDLFLLCRKLINLDCLCSTSYIHRCTLPPENENLCVYPSCDMEGLCVFVQVQKQVYLCDLPNFYESE